MIGRLKMAIFAVRGGALKMMGWMGISSVLILFSAPPAIALNWSDNSINWRYGDKFREPFNSRNIAKNIVSLTHVDAYQYGGNFLNIDMLMSDSNEPLSTTSNTGGNPP